MPRYVTLHEPDWRIDPDELRAAVTPRTRAIVVNTPAQPDGQGVHARGAGADRRPVPRARPARVHRRHLRAPRLRGRAHPAGDAAGHGRADGRDQLDVEDVLRDGLAGRLGDRVAGADGRRPAGPRLPDRRRGGAAPAGGAVAGLAMADAYYDALLAGYRERRDVAAAGPRGGRLPGPSAGRRVLRDDRHPRPDRRGRRDVRPPADRRPGRGGRAGLVVLLAARAGPDEGPIRVPEAARDAARRGGAAGEAGRAPRRRPERRSRSSAQRGPRDDPA